MKLLFPSPIKHRNTSRARILFTATRTHKGPGSDTNKQGVGIIRMLALSRMNVRIYHHDQLTDVETLKQSIYSEVLQVYQRAQTLFAASLGCFPFTLQPLFCVFSSSAHTPRHRALVQEQELEGVCLYLHERCQQAARK